MGGHWRGAMVTLLLGAMLTAALVVGMVMLLVGISKLVLGLVLLPFKILFAVLLFPFWIAKLALKAAGFLVMLPVLLLSGGAVLLIAVVGGLLTVALPLLLVAGIAAVLWMMVRAIFRPVFAG